MDKLSSDDLKTPQTLLAKVVPPERAAANILADEAHLHGLAETARRIYDFRRRRDVRARAIAGDGLFGEPAWDLLLDLFIQSSCGRPVTVSNACVGAAVPATTALRYIAAMEDKGLVERQPNPEDRRSNLLRLTAVGHDMIVDMLRQSDDELPAQI